MPPRRRAAACRAAPGAAAARMPGAGVEGLVSRCRVLALTRGGGQAGADSLKSSCAPAFGCPCCPVVLCPGGRRGASLHASPCARTWASSVVLATAPASRCRRARPSLRRSVVTCGVGQRGCACAGPWGCMIVCRATASTQTPRSLEHVQRSSADADAMHSSRPRTSSCSCATSSACCLAPAACAAAGAASLACRRRTSARASFSCSLSSFCWRRSWSASATRP